MYNDENNPDFSLKELRSNLKDTLRKSGALDTVKAQIRKEFISGLSKQAPKTPYLSNNEVNLRDRTVLSTAYHLLKSRNLHHSLSVFTAESGIDSKCLLLSEIDIVYSLNLDKVTQVMNAVNEHAIVVKSSKINNKKDESSIFDIIIDYCTMNSRKNSMDTCVQTESVSGGSMIPAMESLDDHLRSLRKSYVERIEAEKSNPIRTIDERMIQFERECEAKYHRELNMAVQEVREREISKLHLEVSKQSRDNVEKIRLEMEKEYQNRLKSQEERESIHIKAQISKDREFERAQYEKRQEMQREIDDLNSRIISEARKNELEMQGLRTFELRLKECQILMDSRELELTKREKEVDLKSSEYKQKSEEEARNSLRIELEGLMRDRQALVSDRQRLNDQISDNTALIESANNTRSMLKESQHDKILKEDQIEELKQNITVLEKKLKESINNNQILQISNLQIKESADLLNEKNSKIQSICDQLQIYETKNFDMTHLENKIIEQELELKNMNKTISSIKRSYKNETARATAWQDKCTELENIIEEQKSSLEVFSKQISKNRQISNSSSNVNELIDNVLKKTDFRTNPASRHTETMHETNKNTQSNLNYDNGHLYRNPYQQPCDYFSQHHYQYPFPVNHPLHPPQSQYYQGGQFHHPPLVPTQFQTQQPNTGNQNVHTISISENTQPFGDVIPVKLNEQIIISKLPPIVSNQMTNIATSISQVKSDVKEAWSVDEANLKVNNSNDIIIQENNVVYDHDVNNGDDEIEDDIEDIVDMRSVELTKLEFEKKKNLAKQRQMEAAEKERLLIIKRAKLQQDANEERRLKLLKIQQQKQEKELNDKQTMSNMLEVIKKESENYISTSSLSIDKEVNIASNSIFNKSSNQSSILQKYYSGDDLSGDEDINRVDGSSIVFVDSFNQSINIGAKNVDDIYDSDNDYESTSKSVDEDDVKDVEEELNQELKKMQETNILIQIKKEEEIKLEKQKQEKIKQEILESELKEKSRIEQEKNYQKRIEKDRIEKDRIEKDRIEKERIEKERIEKDRIEKDRIEKERIEKERLEEDERIEKERLEEEERIEQERLEEEERLEERLKEEKIQQERIDCERIEQEKKEQVRLEKERLEEEELNKKNAETEEEKEAAIAEKIAELQKQEDNDLLSRKKEELREKKRLRDLRNSEDNATRSLSVPTPSSPLYDYNSPDSSPAPSPSSVKSPWTGGSTVSNLIESDGSESIEVESMEVQSMDDDASNEYDW